MTSKITPKFTETSGTNKVNKMINDKIKESFPHAKIDSEVSKEIIDILKNEFGFDNYNTVMATSTCPDEINRKSESYFKNAYSQGKREVFTAGGLAGYPFRGKTGMGAFSHHAPEGGNLFLFYGPHVGVSDSGEVGKVLRVGQSHDSSSCGAAMAAKGRYETANKNSKPYIPTDNHLDHEQYVIETELSPEMNDVLKSGNGNKELVEKLMKIIDKRTLEVADEQIKHGHGKLALVGAIVVNTSPNNHDFIDVRRFDVYDNGKVYNLINKLV